MTTIVEDDKAVDETIGVSSGSSVVSTRQWLKTQGRMVIDLSERVPRAKRAEKKSGIEIKAHPTLEKPVPP
jgi:hypothetical protein